MTSILDTLRLLPVSVRGGQVKLMSTAELVVVANRLELALCWQCGRELDAPEDRRDEDRGLCWRCLEREAERDGD
ncbi:MAG: hypothetical protein L0Z50_12855 [Verrucomicrobiales bacterium]|nr:hypothetical protein [Verrucomicrobiales bacterium]